MGRAQSSGVAIETSKGQFRAKKIILATDAWTNGLLGLLVKSIRLGICRNK